MKNPKRHQSAEDSKKSSKLNVDGERYALIVEDDSIVTLGKILPIAVVEPIPILANGITTSAMFAELEADNPLIEDCTPKNHEKGNLPCTCCGKVVNPPIVVGDGMNRKENTWHTPTDIYDAGLNRSAVPHDTESVELASDRLPQRELEAAIASDDVPSVKGGGVVMEFHAIAVVHPPGPYVSMA